MNSEQALIWLQEIWQHLWEWLQTNLFTKESFYQLGILAVVFTLSLWLRKPIKKRLGHLAHEARWPWVATFWRTFSTMLTPFLLLLLLLIAKATSPIFQWKDPILHIAFNVTIAFFVLRIAPFLFKNAAVVRNLAWLVWPITILNIFGLLPFLLELLENIALDIGELHLSLLVLMKGGILLLIMFWISSKAAHQVESRVHKIQDLNPSLKVLLIKSFKIIFYILAGFIVLNSMGIKFTTFAVLGGAVGVGIGFGLQKIVSNLISGVILLLDKSIKPGDVIEVGETFGWIRSMSARYITVITIDGKEHLIPNEDLITNKVVNWSFSDRFIRLNVSVGVAYSTDIPRAMALIQEAALRIPRVLRNPEPTPYLIDFGNSSIDLEIRFWIADAEKGVDNICSEVRVEIWKLFREHQIEIPFPQQDVYIKQIPSSPMKEKEQ